MPLRGLLEGLNEEQRLAVEADVGPVLVVAGAGSGKTRVLILRILHLVGRREMDPTQIVAMTFSNKAAREMRERLGLYTAKSRLKKNCSEVMISTFHSLGLRILTENPRPAGLAPGFGVLDEHDRISLLMGAARRIWPKNQKFDPLDLGSAVSNLKEKGITPETCPVDTEFGSRLPKLYAAYEKSRRASNTVDFEDLIRLPIEMLSGDGEVRARYHAKWKAFLVDEFQDTSQSQLQLLRLLTQEKEGERRDVFVVGDDDQSIYGWRGADLQNLLAFESHFPGARIVKLQQNYRSTGHIISASNAVIARNLLRRAKTVYTRESPGDPLTHHVADDEKSEMDWLLAGLKENVARGGLKWSDQAVLMRTNIQLRELMDEFIVAGVPYVVRGAANLLELPEVRMVIAYAKVVVNPNDELSLGKVLGFPKRGIPRGLLEKASRREHLSAVEALLAYCREDGGVLTRPAEEFLEALLEASRRCRPGAFSAPLRALLEKVGVISAFAENEKKSRNLERFLELFGEREKRAPQESLADILHFLALDTQFGEKEEEKPGVRLMTVHAAKGLEFHTVFLPRLDDDVFPSKKNHTDVGIEEERRLFYVALTRARKRLCLSWPATKVRHRAAREVIPSRFVHEIPEDCWDGPLGKKNLEEKQAYLSDFFTDIQSYLSEA